MASANKSDKRAAAERKYEEVFQRTVDFLDGSEAGRTFLDSLGTDDQLQLYAHYKQVKCGDCDVAKPSAWNLRAYKKHQAWEALIGTPKEQAQRDYVQLVVEYSQDVEGLEELVENCQAWLDEVMEDVASDTTSATKQLASKSQVGTTAAAAAVGAVSKEKKTTVSTVFGFLSYLFNLLLKDLLGIPPLVCRGHLDIANSDLRFAFWQCLRCWTSHAKQQRSYRLYESKIALQWKHALPKNHKHPNVVVGLSVRSLLDLYLRVKQYPAGSEIIVSPPINVPGMMQVFKHHRIKVVGVDLPASSDEEAMVAVDCDAIEKAVSSKTVAIMVVHVFGIIAATDDDMKRIRNIAAAGSREIDVIEDCAEAFSGIGGAKSSSYMGSPHADLSLYSFGFIKTATSLGGGVAIVRGHKESAAKLVKEMHRLHNSSHYQPQQTNTEFLVKVCRAFSIQVLSGSPMLYGLFYFVVSRVLRMDADKLITSWLRGFKVDGKSGKRKSASGEDMEAPDAHMLQIRRRPSPAMMALLHRRLHQSSPSSESVTKRVEHCNKFSELLSSDKFDLSCHVSRPTVRQGCSNCYWLYPLIIKDPIRASKYLRRRGIDATTGSTQLCCIADSQAPCPRASRMMKNTMYLPIGSITEDAGTEAEHHSYCVSIAKSLESFSKTQEKPPQSDRSRGFGLLSVFVLFSFLLIVGSLPSIPRWYIVKAGTWAIQALLSCFFIYVGVLLVARWAAGDFYLQLSSSFAKFSPLLEEPSKKCLDQQADIDTSSSNQVDAPSGILSSINALQVPFCANGSVDPRSIFITGGTGFVGSMVLHDLLLHRKALNIDRVIILCRGKRGRSSIDRIADLLDQPMFSFLSAYEKKTLVEVAEGDTTLTNAGLSPTNIDKICETHNVTHVIHCAAAVSFTQSIKDAGASNITSSLNVQCMSTRLNKKRRAQFVYISTAFVHGALVGEENEPLPEDLYSFGKFDPLEIYKSMCGSQFYAYKAMAELQFPNTYTFSKSVCEHLMMRNDPNTMIIRPSIVGPAAEAPFPGWAGQSPMTIVAAACLFMSYQYNLWSFRPYRVPAIPVDVLSRFIIAKVFCAPLTSEAVSTVNTNALAQNEDSSSDGSFEKVSVGSSSYAEVRSSPSSSVSSPSYRIFNAAWDDDSPDSAFFTWFDFAGALAQVSATMGYASRRTCMIAAYVAIRLLPKLGLSMRQYQKLHQWFVLAPFQLLVSACDAFGANTKSLKQLQSFLDLPLLFFHFTNHPFHFQSSLVATEQLDGLKYVFSCATAAHHFMAKLRARKSIATNVEQPKMNMSFFPIAGASHHKSSPSLLWALTQPQGNFFIRIMGWLLSKILRACYSEVTVDIESFTSTLAAKESGSSIILAPTHRSFFDFLLLSYLSFVLPELQVSIPFIAAADEFERLPFVGWFIQYCGAFFIRRGRIAKDPALFETIAEVKKRSGGTGTIEVFVEGTRSRDRRFNMPKTGVLRCLRDAGGKYVVVPIAISYERIAEQEVLANEVKSGIRASLSVGSMFAWVSRAARGQIFLGRAHIAAAEPLHHLEREIDTDWDKLGQQLQQSQAAVTLVSDYHVDAAAKVLDMDAEDVRRAFSTLGVKFFPSSSSSILARPDNDCEVLSLFFQINPYIAPLVRSSKPEWSEWLSRPSCGELTKDAMKDPSVMLVFASLIRLVDSADKCVESAASQLAENGFSRPTQVHLLQQAQRNDVQVPAALLRASISIRFPETASKSTSSSAKAIVKPARKRVGDDECLGFWGFHDSAFVVRADKNGVPFVTMDGSRYSLRDKRISKLLGFIEAETRMKIDPLNEAFTDQDDTAPACSACQLSQPDIALLKATVAQVSIGDDDRIRHGTGHCQEDIFHIRSREYIRVPDAVAWAATEQEVAEVVALAQEKQWCIVPFGGGTNVTQATRCPPLEVEPRPIISLDMRKMDKILWINEENGVAHIEAGITGRHLEEQLAQRGYTMGHEPDSIEFSTLGGWIATKASGMKRNKYGNIEDIVMSVRVAGPNGLIRHGTEDESHVWGRESCGIDLRSLIFGSEGCLGVVTSAVVRIWPIVEVKDYDSILLSDFEDGLRFVREVSKLGSDMPASIRLLDNEHFRLGMSLRADSSSQMVAMLKNGLSSFIKWKNGFDPKRIVCATITYEGTRKEVERQKRAVTEAGVRHGGVRLGTDVGKSGYELTFMIAYIRDFAMTYHILGESFETFVPWSNIESVIEKTKARIRKEHSNRHLPGEPFIGCRVTQLYHEGACLYFYFCMNFENVDNPSKVYSDIEHAARDEVIAHGGSVSHHHGIGKVRSTFLKQVNSLALQDAMKSVKKGIDPKNVFGARNGTFSTP